MPQGRTKGRGQRAPGTVRRSLLSALLLGVAAAAAPASAAVVTLELAGNSLERFPHFEFVRAFNANETVEVAVDTNRLPSLVGKTARIYVVAAQESWAVGDPLTDAGTGSEVFTFRAGSISANRLVVAAAGELTARAGAALGVGYDVVVDVDRNGALSDGDLVDGGAGEAGLYVVADPATAGPLAVTSIDYAVTGVTTGYTREKTWYPSAISQLGKLPLVVISHGNGHNYTWYDYLQSHLASYGYIVMSHQNNTGPGIETAQRTTLEHTDAILGQQASIAGGVLNGHIDETKIVWIGHSRGGEGVAAAYDSILDGGWTPVHYNLAALKLVSSIAPTDFLSAARSNPHGVNYHLIYGSADGDVGGYPGNDIADSFNVFERASGYRQSTYVHGADHNDFNCCGFEDFDGPPGTAIGRPEAQQVAKSVYLALVKRYVEANVPAEDFFWRQYERFKPIGVASTTTVVSEYRPGPDRRVSVDDYQSRPDLALSSSGGAVTYNVTNLSEGVMNDVDGTFTPSRSDPMNGMTRARGDDTTRGAVFDTNGSKNAFIIWDLPAGSHDLSGWEYLSFRACQWTRHPFTTAVLGDTSWTVGLRDENGRYSLIDFSVYGGGIEEPYQRTGSGTGAGWQNEFETIRIRLSDFLRDGSDLDLTRIRQVGFLFPGGYKARLGIDDLEVTAP